MLDLYPFPALSVEVDTGKIVAVNRAAGEARLAAGGFDSSDSPCAVGPRGVRVEAEELVRYLLEETAAPEGVEIAWQVGDRRVAYRVFSRSAPSVRGQPPLAVLTFVDLTGQKAAEKELREALEARNEFFSVATHELKDPLFALHLSIQLLRHAAEKQGEVPPHVRQHLDISTRQTARLSQLIDNLLDVARISNGRVQIDAEALDLCELVDEVVSRLREKARSAGVEIEVVGHGPLIGYFDRMKLEQVLVNLLTNAIKYGPGQPVTVRVVGDDEKAVVEVEDRGIGIAPEDQGRVFRRFERASSAHKRESLGLGLYIVRSLVEAHGGSIGLRSELGRGTTFAVSLPRKRLHHNEGVPGKEGQGATEGQ